MSVSLAKGRILQHQVCQLKPNGENSSGKILPRQHGSRRENGHAIKPKKNAESNRRQFKSRIPVPVPKSRTHPSRPPLATIQPTTQHPPPPPPPPSPPSSSKSGTLTETHVSNDTTTTPINTTTTPINTTTTPINTTCIPPITKESNCFQPGPLSLAEILDETTPIRGVTTPGPPHHYPCFIPGRFRIPPSHRGSIYNSRRRKKVVEGEDEAHNLFHRLIQSSIKSSRYRSKVNKTGDDNIIVKLETQLNDDIDAGHHHTPSLNHRHLCGGSTSSRLVPNIDANFYLVEEELMGMKWEGLLGGNPPRSTNPIAKLLDQYYFVPVSLLESE